MLIVLSCSKYLRLDPITGLGVNNSDLADICTSGKNIPTSVMIKMPHHKIHCFTQQ